MLDIKGNYPGKYLNKTIYAEIATPKKKILTQILEECDSINRNHLPITKEMIFNEDVQRLKI